MRATSALARPFVIALKAMGALPVTASDVAWVITVSSGWKCHAQQATLVTVKVLQHQIATAHALSIHIVATHRPLPFPALMAPLEPALDSQAQPSASLAQEAIGATRAMLMPAASISILMPAHHPEAALPWLPASNAPRALQHATAQHRQPRAASVHSIISPHLSRPPALRTCVKHAPLKQAAQSSARLSRHSSSIAPIGARATDP